MAKHSPKNFLLSLSLLADDLRRIIEAEVSGFTVDPAASAQRRNQGRDSLEFFARTYFPHYVKYENSLLHEFLYQELPVIVNSHAGELLGVAAPRGEAKSTITSQIFVIWCIVFQLKHFIPIIMDAFDQAATMSEAIKAELEANPRLQMDFPEAVGQGRVWQQGVILTAQNIKVQAFGSGKRMRGLRHGPHRPDLVVCDDLENDENVRSPEQRDKLESWLKKTVLKLGAADGSMDVVYIGTVLHYDSVLSRILKNPLWRTKRFQAVIEWPHRMDLWDKFEEFLLNEGEDAAMAFYRERQAMMDTGAVVSWPSARPLHRLMIVRARDGHEAFDSELQNDPINSKDAPFGTVQYWVMPCRDWIFFGSVDPSLGKNNKGRDPSAILVGGFDREHGILDVVEAAIAKRLPDRIIEDVISMHVEYHCLVWIVEAVQFQEFLRTELVKRSAARGTPVPAVGVTPHADKALRIESLQPHVANGLIRFHPKQKTLLEQLRHWPKADHDDGPDALHMLWMAAISRMGGVPTIATRGRRNTTDLRRYG
ncbi:MAG: phage terminase large subunit [Gammaproteobacteria bacterium]|nr:phage terminase large subunit [Gammaproteobacteria bacterium]